MSDLSSRVLRDVPRSDYYVLNEGTQFDIEGDTHNETSVDMEAKASISLIELAREENPSLFHEIWNYWITDHSLSVFNANGTIRKCQKSRLT